MQINGNEKSGYAGRSVKEMLLAEGYVPERVAVELNGRILPKAEFETVFLEDGDAAEVVSFMGGG